MTGSIPAVSIIIPVLNEAAGINGVIEHLRDPAAIHDAEIIVVDGEVAGSTLSAITDSTVRKIVSPAGRGRQMNLGASQARGRVLLFLHADTVLPRRGFALIRKAMEDPNMAAGAFELGIDSQRALFRITEAYVSVRTRLTRIPFGDQAIFIRREYFERLGGFRDIPIMEDVELMARIRKRGDRIAVIPEKVRTSARRWEREGILSCTMRNWMLQAAYAFGVPPERLAKWYG
jgi:rSAM/selenodomain-associated transferase 2